ncbi:chromosome segregation protein SMC [Arhodomonas sp. AD133]|uniref:chromosome segregation protein SMC n=1 Tax=Arhodomonas sp. AD133 TaxID=3415009 RepID=UPI003EBD320D
MRLSKIKLTGFKSFVDPTTVVLPGDLVAIVGPNGCGKSNVIDAVRWVMGESSAKHLRGESMADVIFNGSTSRKPVGTAAIELIFDNSDGTLGGQYASYNEISVRRQVNREGQSAYYLNGTRCRRRDITDVFLGTGLGPRSYSIIEQGMISRVIEARPEELRRYLEEAAGISLYKERRRETERRIRDTLENLERLEDVREEVGRQLEKLKRQADTAERYKALRAEERQRRAELYVLRLQSLEAERERLEQTLRERDNQIEASLARQRELEREAETVRARHGEDNDRLNDVQARYYAIGSEIARIEQRINHQRELRDSGAREQERARESLEELDATLEQDREKLAVLEERLAELGPEREEVAEQEAAAEERLRAAQEALEAWSERWDRFNAEAAEPAQVAQVERARIEQLERRGEELARRRDRLQLEIEQLESEANDAELRGAEEQAEALAEQAEDLRDALSRSQEAVTELEEHNDELTDEHNNAQGEHHRLQARLTSLETLQEAALGDDDATARWLADNGLDAQERLAHHLRVAPGWERAVEVVLGEHLQAVLVDRLDGCLDAVSALDAGSLVLRTRDDVAGGDTAEAGTLAAQVDAPWPLTDLLARVRTATDMASARALAAELQPGEVVVTPDGCCHGPNWVQANGSTDDDDAGVLAREREIAALREQIAELGTRLERLGERRHEGQQQLAEAVERRDERQDELNAVERDHSAALARLETMQRRVAERRERREARAAELEELAEEIATGAEDVRAARKRQDEALDRSEALDAERERLTNEKLERQEALDEARSALDDVQARRHDLAVKLEGATTARDSLRESVVRMERQRESLQERLTELSENLAALDDPDDELAEERQRLLDERQGVEHELSEARARLGEAEARLRELDHNRGDVEREVGELREGTESARYRSYELKIRAQTQAEQLAELEVDREAVTAELPEQASEAAWEQELERLEARIRRLGPINLAAIDEYQALEERKGYLDSQYDDLTEALETLQSAIRRIDRETRQRFKETFDKVNAGVQQLFPRLFGGGQGYLELTGDDLLETGVSIMARPPGKKVTNIHLLSGGEKALTAVSLVFAIFQLNPAPFCMLDEVDAPLDEANVSRFCDMLRELSDRVQFIVITHNKTTMAAASHLAGVTMNEPGVSRLVAVDVEAAAELAGA